MAGIFLCHTKMGSIHLRGGRMSLKFFVTIGIFLSSQLCLAENPAKGTGDVGSVGRGQTISGQANFKACLDILNAKSNVLKNKIYSISEDGWAFVVRNDDNTMTIYGEDGAEFRLETGKTGKKVVEQHKLKCENVTDRHNASSGAFRITPFYSKAMDDKTTSFEDRKLIKKTCESVAIPAGMMVSGPPMGMFMPGRPPTPPLPGMGGYPGGTLPAGTHNR